MKKVGARKFIDFLWALLHPPRRPEAEEDEQFVDPAAIERPAKATP